MKCISVTGDPALVDRFTAEFVRAMNGLPTAVLDTSREPVCLRFPGSVTAKDVALGVPPSLLIVLRDETLVAPRVVCGSSTDTDPLEVARFTFDGELVLKTGDSRPGGKETFKRLYEKSFELLPQKTRTECGRCGGDCMELAAAVIVGERPLSHCFYHGEDGITVRVDGRQLAIGEYPAEALDRTVRGFLSTLKGYREGLAVRINLPSE